MVFSILFLIAYLAYIFINYIVSVKFPIQHWGQFLLHEG